MRMRRVAFLSMISPALQNFTRYLINGSVSKKKKEIIDFVCFDFLYNFCLKRFSF